jgi:nucleotide-binding universal stress UspA family protein
MLESVLVPLDGSEFSEHTLPFATAVARASGAQILLAHVHVPHPPEDLLLNPQFQFQGVDMEEYEERYRSEEEEYLKGLAERLAEEVGKPVTQTLLEGEVSSAIERALEASHADMILMSTHGRTGLSRFWLGSVADELVRHVSVPVLLVPPMDGKTRERADRGFRHVLVPLDGSELGESILEPAIELGTRWDAKFTLLHVVPTGRMVGARTYPIPMGHLEDRRDRAREYLATVSEKLQARGLEVSSKVVDHSSPARAILLVAESDGVDLIALSTHGHRRLTRAVLGSVADKVVRGTSVPVLVKKPAQ